MIEHILSGSLVFLLVSSIFRIPLFRLSESPIKMNLFLALVMAVYRIERERFISRGDRGIITHGYSEP